jgi:hypothetical protein
VFTRAFSRKRFGTPGNSGTPASFNRKLTIGSAPWRATFTATGRNAMPHTLTTAAAATGLNRTTILRAIKSGKISGAKDEHQTS